MELVTLIVSHIKVNLSKNQENKEKMKAAICGLFFIVPSLRNNPFQELDHSRVRRSLEYNNQLGS